MYRCQLCNKVVPSSTRTTKLVVATRERVYEARGQDPRERRGPRTFRGRRGPRKKKPYDKGGQGTEIVRELSVCPSCAIAHADTPPQHQESATTLDVHAALARSEEGNGSPEWESSEKED
jgi:hypothetical protein